MTKKKKFFLSVIVVAILGIVFYRFLPPHRKQQLRFLLKQAPSLPGRYMV
ncbi:MAG: hypothetical protein M0P04_02940 [Syntrophales bacterium]|jgi:hypothetical protein|nr:hypothetical protein [Syntrophales bacterium]MDD4338390.1 hypothetical protein [Syntrophales bacterium]HOG06818.1 hypothetical protein [Syntrophales bacterium]HOS78451.1 hypothetical protein [Syntrophales bacterium]HPB70182.1 hypothetical protein [Syntrophales bacterium]